MVNFLKNFCTRYSFRKWMFDILIWLFWIRNIFLCWLLSFTISPIYCIICSLFKNSLKPGSAKYINPKLHLKPTLELKPILNVQVVFIIAPSVHSKILCRKIAKNIHCYIFVFKGIVLLKGFERVYEKNTLIALLVKER